MKSHEFITEGPESSDYQQMLNFVNNNKTPGVPPEQQVALAMFRELNKQQAQNKQLGAELKAAEQRIDIASQGGELSTQELGKHRAELERERGDIDKQRDKMGKIDQKNSEREKASAEQLQNLTAQLDQIKQKPGVDPNATKELEKQMDELKKNGLDADKYRGLEQQVAKMQNMQQVDDKTMQSLIGQVKDAQAKAAEIGAAKNELGKQIDTATGNAEEQLAQLRQQLAQLNGVTSAMQSAVVDVIPQQIEKVGAKVQELDGENEMVYDELEKHDSLLRKLTTPQAPPNAPPQAPPAAPALAPPQRQPEPTFEDSQLMKSIKWATGK